MSASPPPSEPRSYRDALRRLRPALGGTVLFSALVNVLMLTGSLYMLQVYDRVLTSGSVPTLLGLFAIVVVLFGFLGFYDFLRRRLLARAGLRLDRAMGRRAFEGGLAGGSELRDLDTVRSGLASPGAIALFDLPFVPLFLGLLWLLHPMLGALTLAGAAVGGALALIGRHLTRKATEAAATPEENARAIELGARRAGETVSALGLSQRLAARWRDHRDRQFAEAQRGTDPADALAAASRAVRMLLQSAILTLAAYLVLQGTLTAGMIIASSILSGRALAPIDQIAGQIAVLSRSRAAHRRLLDSLPEAETGPETRLAAPAGRLEDSDLLRLVPQHGGQAEPPRILSEVGFELAPGDVLGVVGGSGSGKSTLARLLVGAMRPDGGEIRLDGATLDQWTAADRSRFLGYLPQRVEMLPGTVRDNIARFDPEADDGSVFDAARRAGVHEMILHLPEGYDTRVEEAWLSGGQMQRIALARALHGSPALVVLDEPNSNLDEAGEAALSRAVTELSAAGTTVIVIAHRARALQSANKLLVLNEGRVAAFGPAGEVLRARGAGDGTRTAPAANAGGSPGASGVRVLTGADRKGPMASAPRPVTGPLAPLPPRRRKTGQTA